MHAFIRSLYGLQAKGTKKEQGCRWTLRFAIPTRCPCNTSHTSGACSLSPGGRQRTQGLVVIADLSLDMEQRELALHRQLWLQNHRTSAQCVMLRCSTKHEGPGGNGPSTLTWVLMHEWRWMLSGRLGSALGSMGPWKCHFTGREKPHPVFPRWGSKQCWEVLISSPIPSTSFPAQRRMNLFKTMTLSLVPGLSVNKG